MNATPKKKLCWNCEGRVSLEEENCTYCGVYLGPAPGDEGSQDILTPPYRLVESEEQEDSQDQEVPASRYQVDEEQDQETEDQPVDVAAAKQDIKQIVVPIALLSGGAICLLFGLVLWLFSHDGSFTLTWDSEYWYGYLIVALLMIFFGWRALQHCDVDVGEEGTVHQR